MGKRDDILIPLSWDHHHGLRLSLTIRKAFEGDNHNADELRALVLERWESELRGHFQDEEAVIQLLPDSIRTSSPLDELIGQMFREHQEIGQLIADLESSDAGSGGSLMTFADALKAHIRFEERELFPELQKHLEDPGLRRQVAERLAARRDADGRTRSGEDELLDVGAE